MVTLKQEPLMDGPLPTISGKVQILPMFAEVGSSTMEHLFQTDQKEVILLAPLHLSQELLMQLLLRTVHQHTF